MTEVASKFFVNEDNRSLILGRVMTYRQGIIFRVKNNTANDVIPLIGLGAEFTTVDSFITGPTIVPNAFGDIILPAVDANDNMFNERYVFLDYTDPIEEVVGLGLEFSIMQDVDFRILYFVDEGVKDAF